MCSRRCPADIVLKSYDWAIAQMEKGVCVISGFHSKTEKDVLRSLLKDYGDMTARIIADDLEQGVLKVTSMIRTDKIYT